MSSSPPTTEVEAPPAPALDAALLGRMLTEQQLVIESLQKLVGTLKARVAEADAEMDAAAMDKADAIRALQEEKNALEEKMEQHAQESEALRETCRSLEALAADQNARLDEAAARQQQWARAVALHEDTARRCAALEASQRAHESKLKEAEERAIRWRSLALSFVPHCAPPSAQADARRCIAAEDRRQAAAAAPPPPTLLDSLSVEPLTAAVWRAEGSIPVVLSSVPQIQAGTAAAAETKRPHRPPRFLEPF